MATDTDPYKLSRPHGNLLWMIIFLILTSFAFLILYRQIVIAFMANPGLNGIIIATLILGIALSFRQVIRLFPELKWVNEFRIADDGLAIRAQPRLLAPMATLLGDKLGRMAISPQTMRSILDSIGMRLDEARDVGRYLTGLLVFLGLLGTFWGLSQTVASIGKTIQTLDITNGDLGIIFENLKTGLSAPLSGMGTAFSSSLFGLAGSLILGFLELQANQAQNRFYTELEDWLSTLTSITPDGHVSDYGMLATNSELQKAIEHLAKNIEQNQSPSGEPGLHTMNATMENLAEGIQSLVQHMRSEQQMIRNWVEAQSEQQEELRKVLEKINMNSNRPINLSNDPLNNE